ncbi:MAG TPA: glucose 1-dehydrogenase [Candidatus Angelobacter sp.]|jgi:threonine dehydrogenase-like Zn-dependent dehydrogenase|nr:glucose 1-dehydrogenase [Candidatus Angelobacter sp.]
MQALAVFPSKRHLGVVELPRPKLQRGSDVLLRVREVGLCGTDREIVAFEHGSPPAGSDHLVLGHESLAEVVEVGGEVRGLGPGDLVVAIVRRPCDHPECRPCRAGRSDFCITGDFIERGIKQADGFLTEYVLDDQEYLVRVPKALADVAVLIEPLTVVAKAGSQSRTIFDRLPYEPGSQHGLVVGAGPVGLLGAMVLAANGYETVVYSREPEGGEKGTLVQSLGGTYISAASQPIESLVERTGEFDLILEAVGFAPVMMAAARSLGPNGVMALTGIPAEGAAAEISVGRSLRDLVLRNQVVFGTVNAGRRDYMAAIQLLEQFMILFPESVRKLITRRIPLGEASRVLLDGGGIKNVVQLNLRAA